MKKEKSCRKRWTFEVVKGAFLFEIDVDVGRRNEAFQVVGPGKTQVKPMGQINLMAQADSMGRGNPVVL